MGDGRHRVASAPGRDALESFRTRRDTPAWRPFHKPAASALGGRMMRHLSATTERGPLSPDCKYIHDAPVTMIEEVLLQAKSFCVVRRQVVGPDGQSRAKEVVRHPGAAAVLPLLDDGRIVLIENFRAPAGRRLLELPAGSVEPGEDPAATALRELAEETGYRARTLEPLVRFYSSPGVLDEVMHLFVATRLEPGAPDRQEGEDIHTRLLTWPEAWELLHAGRVEDAKTIAGLLYYAAFKAGDRYFAVAR